jgi:hypothetical protein
LVFAGITPVDRREWGYGCVVDLLADVRADNRWLPAFLLSLLNSK